MVLAAFVLVLAAAATFAAGIATSRTSDTLVYVSIVFSLAAFVILAIASLRARQAARTTGDTEWTTARLRSLETDAAPLLRGLDETQLDMAPNWRRDKSRRSRRGPVQPEPEPEPEPEPDELERQLEMEEEEADAEVPVGAVVDDEVASDGEALVEEDELVSEEEALVSEEEEEWEPEEAAVPGAFRADHDRERRAFARQIEDELREAPALEDELDELDALDEEEELEEPVLDEEEPAEELFEEPEEEEEEEPDVLDVPQPRRIQAEHTRRRRRISAGAGSLDLMDDYDDLTAAEIVPVLHELDVDDLRWVQRRERSGYKRPAILTQVEELLADAGGRPRRRAASSTKKAAKKTARKKAAPRKAAAKKTTGRKTAAKKTTSRAKKTAAKRASKR